MIETDVRAVLEAMRRPPFSLDDEAIAWVKSHLASLSPEEKIGQLFCNILGSFDRDAFVASLEVCKPGGLMYVPADAEAAIEFSGALRDLLPVPALIAANLEKGGDGIVAGGVSFGSPTAVAATDDVANATRLGDVCGAEGAAVGANWAFAPIIDIDDNFRNPITGLRTFGSNPERVRDMGVAYVEAVQAHGVAASIKHFPGDGRDERDQHLVTTVNDLSVEEWDATYGEVYRASIEAGAMTVMVGHIQQPEYSRTLRPGIRDEDILPGSLAPEIMGDLLRGKLGFNGLTVTDASTMAGFLIPLPRSKAVPAAIAAGADMFLFARNLAEDVAFMRAGVEDGTITPGRFDSAVARVLGLKAALGLHKPAAPLSVEAARATIGSDRHQQWSQEIADRSITLVKEQDGVLPLSPQTHKRILFIPLEDDSSEAYGVRVGACEEVRQLLVAEGFEAATFVAPTSFDAGPTTDVTDAYDAIVYVANISTQITQNTVRITWAQPFGSNTPQFVASVPTIFVSLENPYHLLDVPRVKTFINTFGSTPTILKALVDKLVGRSAFTGTSPADPFCGRWDARL
ncbi:glycoside hydrolase family 3 protein [Microbacterium sp.]|uniref:glycoside hydrolase family 3 protein n=1 Tax=Microbacterium sp. TaxID=51671 RepID=UPI0039E2FB44